MFEIFKNKKVLITGHSGFKGSWLMQWLELIGAEVKGVSLKPETSPSHFSVIYPETILAELDIRDSKVLDKTVQAFDPDFIFHLAAQPLVLRSYEDPHLTYSTNVMGTFNVLESCRNLENLKGILVVTTDKCYENQEKPEGYTETDRLGGYDPYSSSKACTEILTASYRDSFLGEDISVATARAGNVIGGGDWSDNRLIPDFIKKIRSGEVLNIRYPDAVRPWQHVLDCLASYLTLAEKMMAGDSQVSGAWNFGPDESAYITVKEMIETVWKLWPGIEITFGSEKKKHETTLLKLNTEKATKALGLKNVWDVNTTLAKTVEWYRAYYEKGEVLSRQQIMEFERDYNG